MPLLLGPVISSFGQQFLMYQKNKYQKIYFKPGDFISFKIKDDRFKITDQIKKLEDNQIVFDFYKVHLDEITHFYIDDDTQNWSSGALSNLLPIAGTGYLLLDVINTGDFYPNTMIISGSMVGTGLLVKWLTKKKTRLKGSRKLMIINI